MNVNKRGLLGCSQSLVFKYWVVGR